MGEWNALPYFHLKSSETLASEYKGFGYHLSEVQPPTKHGVWRTSCMRANNEGLLLSVRLERDCKRPYLRYVNIRGGKVGRGRHYSLKTSRKYWVWTIREVITSCELTDKWLTERAHLLYKMWVSRWRLREYRVDRARGLIARVILLLFESAFNHVTTLIDC